MALPCLPQNDPHPEQRSEDLGERRATYRYAYTWPPEVAVAAEVPKSDGYPPDYIARLLGVTADIFRNVLPAADLFVSRDDVHDFLAGRLERLQSLWGRTT